MTRSETLLTYTSLFRFNFNWGRIIPFDEKKIDRPMSRIEVAEVMLAVLGALQATRLALASIKRGDDPQENIDILAKEVEALNARWEDFTGWRPADGN